MNMIQNRKSTQTHTSCAVFSSESYGSRGLSRLLISLALILLSTNARAEEEKQISYPVAIPIEHTAASSVAAPEYKAPQPVIRSIEEASSVPTTGSTKVSTKAKRSAKKSSESEIASEDTSRQDDSKKSAAAKKHKSTTAKKSKGSKSQEAGTPVKGELADIPLRKSAPAKSVSRAEAPTSAEAEKKNAEIQNSEQTKNAAPINTLITNALPATISANPLINDLEENPSDIPFLDPQEQEAPVNETIQSLTPPSTDPLVAQHEPFVTEFQHYVETRVVPNVPGAALAIIANGEVKVLQGYGVKKSGGRDPVNTDTVFRLASVSKTIASTAASILVREGQITWDTPVTSVLPEVEFSNPRYGNAVTLRDIMSQATGLPTHTFTNLIEENIPYEETVKRLRYINFVCPPGKCYAYQNVTYSLISNIILRKTHETYDQYVKEKLFVPLGMNSASFGLDGLKASNNFALPNVMTARGRWYTTDIEENYYHIYPAAGANASIRDMSRWVLAQIGRNPDVLSKETLNQIHAKVTINTPAQSHYGAREGVTDTHYGLGWRVFDYRGDKNFVHHGGWVKGFRSEVVFSPELQIGMVFLTNSETRYARDIIFKFLDAYEDDKRGVNKIVAAVPEDKRTRKKN